MSRFNTFRGEIIPSHWEIYEPEKENYEEGEIIGFAAAITRCKVEEILVWTQGWIVGMGPHAYRNYLKRQDGVDLRKQTKKDRKKGKYDELFSTYRVFTPSAD